jgi:hypothetical protein
MSVLGTSVTAARRRNAPVFVALPAGAEYASPNALHRHAVRLRDVLFPPAAAGDEKVDGSAWLVLCQARPPPADRPGAEAQALGDSSTHAIHAAFLNAAFQLDGMGAAIAMKSEARDAVSQSAAVSLQSRRRAAWEAQHQKPLSKVLRELARRVRSAMFRITGEDTEEDEEGDESFWYDQDPRSASVPAATDAAPAPLPVTLSLAVVDCDEKRYAPKLFRPPDFGGRRGRNTMHDDDEAAAAAAADASGKREAKLWSLSMGLGLQLRGVDVPTMFVTAHRRATQQLTAAEVRSANTVLRAANRVSNYQGKLASIRSNDDLRSKCLDGSVAEGCVLVLRRGPLDEQEGDDPAASVRSALRAVLPKHRHLLWAQIDLDEHDLQPMPKSGGGGAAAWPRLALVRRAPREVQKKKKEQKKKATATKKKNKKKRKTTEAIVKETLVTSWQWYPASRSMSDADAISAFIEDADQANWATMTPRPSAAKHRLRVVKQRAQKSRNKKKAKKAKAKAKKAKAKKKKKGSHKRRQKR